MAILADYYDGEIYVFIKNQNEEFKKLLGGEQAWLGTSLLNAQRKQPHRRGPSDRRIIDTCERLGLSSEPEQIVALTFNEAFLLVYHHKCISIRIWHNPSHVRHDSEEVQLQKQQVLFDQGTTSEVCSEKKSRIDVADVPAKTTNDGDYLDVVSCRLIFNGMYKRWTRSIKFETEFCVFYHYYSLGWIVKSGENYGTDFLLYEGGPLLDHARYGCIIVLSTNDPLSGMKSDMTYQALMAHSRVIQSVSKELLLAVVEIINDGDGSDFEIIRKNTSISSKTFIKHSINLTTL